MNAELSTAPDHAVHAKRMVRRILVRRGIETLCIKRQDIAVFYTQNKLVFAIDFTGQKFLCDQKLNELEQGLYPHSFFRVNRQYLVNIDAIESFRPCDRVKLELRLRLEHPHAVVTISQQTAPSFKKWIGGA